MALDRRHLDIQDIAAEFLDHDFVTQEFVPNTVRIRVGPINLIDRNDNRNPCGLSVVERFDGLRLHTVVSGNYENHDIGHLRAARAHGRKGLMPRRIDKGYPLSFGQVDLVGADVLGDPSGFAARHIRGAQRVQQRCLAVIDMAHDGHHRGARHHILLAVFLAFDADLDIRLRDELRLVAEIGDDQFRRVRVDDLVDIRHDVETHQRLDDIDTPYCHPICQIGHRDGFRNYDFAHDLLYLATIALFLGALPFTLAGSTNRRQTPHAIFFDPISLIQGLGDR